MTVSVVVATYNWPEALELSIKSLLVQSRLPDEIIVGDDGSGAETREVIERLRKISPVRIFHVWHEDKGFRLARIRNRAVLASSGEYIIQIDGDIIAHPRFIEDHMRYAKRGCYLRGGRVMLGKTLTERLCRTREMKTLKPWSRGIEKKRWNALRLPWLGNYLADRYRLSQYALGCNMSYFRCDFFAVNGYDEFFEGWGGEDSDYFRRLKLYGIKNRRLKFVGLTYHLWHRVASQYNHDRNKVYCERDSPAIRCINGAIKPKD